MGGWGWVCRCGPVLLITQPAVSAGLHYRTAQPECSQLQGRVFSPAEGRTDHRRAESARASGYPVGRPLWGPATHCSVSL